MGIFVKRSITKKEKRDTSLSDPRIARVFGAVTDGDLPHMNHRIAVGIPAVYTCVDIKSSDIAMLPRHLYQRTKEGREKVIDDDQLFLIKTQPNEHMNAYDFWRLLLIDKYLWGNGYALKNLDDRGRPGSYTILQPNEVDVYQDPHTGQVVYTDLNNHELYPPDRIIHLKGFTFDGVKGVSVITLARLAFQKGVSIEKFAANFYHNKTNLAGWIEFPEWLEDDSQQDKLLDAWRRKYQGYGKSDTAILMGGSKYHQITMKMTDAQFVENQKLSLEQIAMLFRIPPTRLGFLEKANRSNMEGTFLEYATYTLQSEVVQIEQEMNIKILRHSQRNTHYWKLELNAILRGDHAGRSVWVETMMKYGLMTRDEIRELDDLNPIPDGHRTILPLNMVFGDRLDEYIDAILEKSIQRKISQNGRKSTGNPGDLAEVLHSNDN